MFWPFISVSMNLFFICIQEVILTLNSSQKYTLIFLFKVQLLCLLMFVCWGTTNFSRDLRITDLFWTYKEAAQGRYPEIHQRYPVLGISWAAD